MTPEGNQEYPFTTEGTEFTEKITQYLCALRVLRGDLLEPFVINRCIKDRNTSREAHLDEPTLIRHAANGDLAAWEPLMQTHQQAVFRFAYLLLGDPDDAEDIAQETFLRAWRYLKRFDPSRPLRPWLLSITANLASNRRRSASRYLAALTRAFRHESSATIEEKSTQHIEADTLWQAVRTLDLADQQIIYLRYFLELPVQETAQTLNIAEGTVKSRLNRALEKLRQIIK
jgi:RNA polymerase sigma-70 factor (ECF subfamily)